MAEETSESFQSRMTETVLAGFRLTSLALGVKLGLFNVLSDTSESLTSDELATRADCKERYVREWLHHMVMCDVIEVDETGTKFTLPAHRRDALINQTQLLPTFGVAFPFMMIPHKEILDCFHKDGPTGLPFEKVCHFYTERAYRNIPSLKYCADFLKDDMPGLKDKLAEGIQLCDIGCGKGIVVLHLASQFPKSQFMGVDLCEEFIVGAKESAADQGLSNVDFFLQDATELPQEWRDSLDVVIVRDALHDMAHVSKAIECIYNCLKPGGQLAAMEVNLSSNPHLSLQDPKQKFIGQMAYCISTYYCLTASLNTPGSAGLGSGAGTEKFVQLFTEAGFVLDDKPTLATDNVNVLIICNKPTKEKENK